MTQRHTILPIDTIDAIVAAARQEIAALYTEMDWPESTIPTISPGLVRVIIACYEQCRQEG